MMVVFALLFFVTLFFSIKHITSPSAPFYVFSVATSAAAWIVLFTSESVSKILLFTVLSLSGVVVYFMMRTKPYEKP
jgi:hypothetical protein